MRDRPDAENRQPSMDASGAGAIESNAALARRIAAQEQGAFAILVDRYHEFVFRICFGILRHRQDAEDATQDTFSRVARYLDRWDPRRPQSESTPQGLAAHAMREEIALAMKSLPDRQRIAFELFHEKSMSYNEIATRMDCPLGTVKTLVHRARLSLIDQLRRRDVVSSAATGISRVQQGELS